MGLHIEGDSIPISGTIPMHKLVVDSTIYTLDEILIKSLVKKSKKTFRHGVESITNSKNKLR